MNGKTVMKFGFGLIGLTLMALLGAASCAPVTLLNSITPSGSFEKSSDISYGPLSRQTLDIYKSENAVRYSPVIIFVHGGGWTDGHKGMYKFLAEGFTAEGFDVVVPNYRLYPDAVYPQMIEDTAQAVNFTAQQFPNRPLILMGHSAGAYNVLMTALDPHYLEKAGSTLCKTVAGVVSLAGPTGIIPLKEEPYITIFPDRFTQGDAPLNNVTRPMPPVFFGHGAEDKTVYPQNSERLADAITARGGAAQVKIYEGMSHIDVVKVLSRHFDGGENLKQDIINFVKALPQSNGEGAMGYCLQFIRG